MKSERRSQREGHREKDRFRKREGWKSKLCARLYRKLSICLAQHMPKSRGPRIREKGKEITSGAFLMKPILAIRDKIRRVEMFPNLSVKDRFKNFRKNGG